MIDIVSTDRGQFGCLVRSPPLSASGQCTVRSACGTVPRSPCALNSMAPPEQLLAVVPYKGQDDSRPVRYCPRTRTSNEGPAGAGSISLSHLESLVFIVEIRVHQLIKGCAKMTRESTPGTDPDENSFQLLGCSCLCSAKPGYENVATYSVRT